MKKSFKIGILLIGVSLFFTSCEKDEVIITETQEHVGKNPNEVSLDFFKQTTNIENLETFIRKGSKKNNDVQARENSELTFDDFIIDTEQIYQCIQNDGDLSFSFHIEPIVECLPTEEFNLVIKQNEQGEWQSKIYQLNANTDGTSQNKFSSIEEIHSSNDLPDGFTARWVGMWGETTTFHCTHTGSCSSGTCDNCSLCVTTTVTYQVVYISDEGSGYNSGTGEPDFNYNGGGGGSGSSMPNITKRNELIDLLDLQAGSQQHMYISGSSTATLEILDTLIDYAIDNSTPSRDGTVVNIETIEFINELIMLLRWESSNDTTIDFNALNFIIQAKEQDKIYNDLNMNFLNSVNQYLNIDTATNPDATWYLMQYLSVKCAVLRANNPDWSDIKIYWEASKDLVHLALDVFGLVPVVGELADLTNGVLYTIEGDGVNASLSYASAIPFVGWVSSGTKLGLKVVNVASDINSKVKLVWKITADGLVEFGRRSQLRKVLNITNSALHAHHLIPWAQRIHPAIQKAAKSSNAFHLNEALNGIPMPNSLHLTGHSAYSTKILEILNSINPNATVDEAYDFVSGLANHIRDLITNNPSLNSGQIADLINFP